MKSKYFTDDYCRTHINRPKENFTSETTHSILSLIPGVTYFTGSTFDSTHYYDKTRLGLKGSVNTFDYCKCLRTRPT